MSCDTQQSKESTSLESKSSAAGDRDATLIGFSYGQNSVTYVSRYPGKNITLKQFKSFINNERNFKYFFKRVCDIFGTGVVLEEAFDDDEVLPLWEGKIVCVIEPVEEDVN